MTKTSKSTAMIRRRRQKPPSSEFSKARNKTLSSSICDEKKEHQQTLLCEDIVGSPTIQKIMSSDKTVFLGLLVIRLVNAMLIQTFFVPDEFWQSLEVAHKMVFNYGYLTWEWQAGIRSYAYPLLFATLYQVLRILGLDNRLLLIKMPRLLQGVLASTGDLFLFRLSRRLGGAEIAQWTLLCHMLSWFTAYCCTRTLTNSAETVLVTAALFYFPWPGYPQLTVLGLATIIDRVWYGQWVFVHFNFLAFNVLTGGSAFYGSHPWHWYFTQGLPVVLGSHLLPFLLGARLASNKVLLLLLVWTVGILSFLSHKEMRFLLPVLPLAMHYCGVFFYNTSMDSLNLSKSTPKEEETVKTDANMASDDDMKADHPDAGGESQNSAAELSLSSKHRCEDVVYHTSRGSSAGSQRQRLRRVKYLVILLALSNLLPLLYFSLIHQRGTMDVMNHLYDAISKARQNDTSPTSVNTAVDILFLMPCHSTPFYSFLHVNVSMRFLTCEPNLHHIENYTDEADVFFQDPDKWLSSEFDSFQHHLPTHIVYFDCLQDHIHHFLQNRNYRQCATFFHTHIPEGRIGSHVMVSCR
ncbi:hypothetical protein BaRGS_00020234 [Batillaria attramentaria]|uniref:Mannosyltransferase n=1 Tax=Batillaria attramentaria TaxID=370345 RepID=A0ABD0KMX9_9CAEN